jgi:hypothetical protein
MSDLLSPRRLAAGFGWLPGLLATVGLVAITFEVALGHPEAVRFARDGRTVTGQVTTEVKDGLTSGVGLQRRRTRIFVDDPELGPQTIEVSRELRLGAQVPLFCLTPARRCESAEVVRERLSLWPLTPVVLSGASALAVAMLMLLARLHLRRRRQGAATPSGAVVNDQR